MRHMDGLRRSLIPFSYYLVLAYISPSSELVLRPGKAS
jgi:hypothetical protein